MELTGNNGFTRGSRGSPGALIPFYGYETGPSGIAVETRSERAFPPLVLWLVAVARKPCRA